MIVLFVNMFYCGRIIYTEFKHTDIKGMRFRDARTAPLDGSRFENRIRILVDNTKLHMVQL